MKTKKLLSLGLAVVMTLSMGTGAFATIDPVMEAGTNFNSIEVNIDPYDLNAVEQAIVSYNMMPEVANDMRDYSAKCIAGEIEEGSIVYSVPIDRASSSRTYTGYGNRKYYEEYVEYGRSVSREAEIDSGIVTNASDDERIDLLVEFTVDAIVNEATDNTYGVLKILLKDLGVGKAYEIGARLCETKTKRYTYIYEGNSLHMGSLTEQVYFYFNYTTNGDRSGSSYPQTWRTPEFAKNYDKIAYFSYPNGGEQQFYSNYYLNGVEFNSHN